MNKIKKVCARIWLTGCLLVCLSLTVQSCISMDDINKAQPIINKELDNIEILTKRLEDAFASHRAGELTTDELSGLTIQIRDSITSSRNAIVKIKQDSVGWGSMVVAVLVGMLSRGIPSKGPLAMLFNVFTTRRKET